MPLEDYIGLEYEFHQEATAEIEALKAGGGVGEVYVDINSTGIVPDASGGAEAIAIGAGATVTDDEGIAIGFGTTADDDATAVGSGASAAFRGTAYGKDAISDNRGVSIGRNSEASGTESLAFGNGAVALSGNFIAIGGDAGGDGSGSICIGGDSVINTVSDAICLGGGNDISAADSITIGTSLTVPGAAANSISLGGLASAASAVQIGAGTNAVASTMQFLGTQVATADGIFIPSTTGAPVSTPVAGTSRFDASTGILYIYDGSSWLSTTLT